MKKKSNIKISSTYAKAWYDGAVQEKELEKAFAESKMLEKAFSAEDIKNLSSPIIPQNIKTQIINEISKKLKLSSITSSFLNVLNDNKRISHLSYILKDFNSLYFKGKDIVEVFVQTVKPLTSSQNEKLEKSLEKFLSKKVAINYEISPDIIGGLKIMYDTYQIDDSIKGKLTQVERIMKGNE